MIVAWLLRAALAQADPTPGYTAIQTAFLQEQFDRVASLAQTFILQNPQVPEVPRVWLWLALSLDRLQQANDALRELDRLKTRLTANDRLWPEVLFWEGDISRRALHMARAKTAYQQLLTQYPDTTWGAQAQLGVGLVYLHQQSYEVASTYFQQVAAQRAGTTLAVDARLFEGLCELRLNRFTEAIATLESIVPHVQTSDTGAQANFYLAESYTGAQRYGEAIQAYQRALSAGPTSSWAHLSQFGLGWAYFQDGHCAESIELFQRYLQQPPVEHQSEALFAQGSCLLQAGREVEALSRFKRIIAEDPKHPLAFESGLLIVDGYRRQGEFQLARELLQTLLKRPLDTGSRAKVQLKLGLVALEDGNPAQAQTVLQLAREQGDPATQQVAMSGLADVKLYQADIEGARQLYEQAIAAAPTTITAAYATYQLGRMELQAGQPAEAVKRFEMLSAHPDPAIAGEARLGLLIAALANGQDEQAQVQLMSLKQQYAGGSLGARVSYYEAMLAMEHGDEQAAQRLCEETIARAPATEEALDARLLLADLRLRHQSTAEVIGWLADIYEHDRLTGSHRAKVAKRLGDLARAERMYVKAIRWYDVASQLSPALTAEATYLTASCYEEGGDVRVAIPWYQHVEASPWQVRGQLAAAKLLEHEDRMVEAEAIYQSLAGQPIPEAAMAKERLSELRQLP